MSPRSIVAFTVKWTMLDAGGNTVSRSFNYIQPSGLFDGVKPKRELTYTPQGGREHRVYLWVTPLEKVKR